MADPSKPYSNLEGDREVGTAPLNGEHPHPLRAPYPPHPCAVGESGEANGVVVSDAQLENTNPPDLDTTMPFDSTAGTDRTVGFGSTGLGDTSASNKRRWTEEKVGMPLLTQLNVALEQETSLEADTRLREEAYRLMRNATRQAKASCPLCGKRAWRRPSEEEATQGCNTCGCAVQEVCSAQNTMIRRPSIKNAARTCNFRLCGRCLFAHQGKAKQRVYSRIVELINNRRPDGYTIHDRRFFQELGRSFQELNEVQGLMLTRGTSRLPRPSLHRCVQLGQVPLVLQILKERHAMDMGADDLSQSAPGWSPGWTETPLMTAVQAFHLPPDLQLSIVKALLEHGASLQAKDCRGRLPITLAVMAAPGAVWTTRSLLQNGIPAGTPVLCKVGHGEAERWRPGTVVERRERLTVLQADAPAPRERLLGFGPRFVHKLRLDDRTFQDNVPLQNITLNEPPIAGQLDMGSRILFKPDESSDWLPASVVDFSRRGKSRFDIEVKRPQMQFAIGDRVEVRDKGDSIWRSGIVTSTETEPPLVRVEGWEQSFGWDEARRYGVGGVEIAATSGESPDSEAHNILSSRARFWEAPQAATDHWVVLDTGRQVTLNDISITHGGNDYSPSECIFQASVGAVTGPWRTVLTFRTERVSFAQRFDLPIKVESRYFRLVIKDVHGGGGSGSTARIHQFDADVWRHKTIPSSRIDGVHISQLRHPAHEPPRRLATEGLLYPGADVQVSLEGWECFRQGVLQDRDPATGLYNVLLHEKVDRRSGALQHSMGSNKEPTRYVSLAAELAARKLTDGEKEPSGREEIRKKAPVLGLLAWGPSSWTSNSNRKHAVTTGDERGTFLCGKDGVDIEHIRLEKIEGHHSGRGRRLVEELVQERKRDVKAGGYFVTQARFLQTAGSGKTTETRELEWDRIVEPENVRGLPLGTVHSGSLLAGTGAIALAADSVNLPVLNMFVRCKLLTCTADVLDRHPRTRRTAVDSTEDPRVLLIFHRCLAFSSEGRDDDGSNEELISAARAAKGANMLRGSYKWDELLMEIVATESRALRAGRVRRFDAIWPQEGGLNALGWACRHANEKVLDCLLKEDRYRSLLLRPYNAGRHPLVLLVYALATVPRKIKLLETLLDVAGDAQVTVVRQSLALSAAAGEGQHQIVEILLRAGANTREVFRGLMPHEVCFAPSVIGHLQDFEKESASKRLWGAALSPKHKKRQFVALSDFAWCSAMIQASKKIDSVAEADAKKTWLELVTEGASQRALDIEWEGIREKHTQWMRDVLTLIKDESESLGRDEGWAGPRSNWRLDDTESPLALAVRLENTEIIRCLLDGRACDPNEEYRASGEGDPGTSCPLSIACQWNGGIDTAKLLFERGARVNSSRALACAAARGNRELLSLFLNPRSQGLQLTERQENDISEGLRDQLQGYTALDLLCRRAQRTNVWVGRGEDTSRPAVEQLVVDDVVDWYSPMDYQDGVQGTWYHGAKVLGSVPETVSAGSPAPELVRLLPRKGGEPVTVPVRHVRPSMILQLTKAGSPVYLAYAASLGWYDVVSEAVRRIKQGKDGSEFGRHGSPFTPNTVRVGSGTGGRSATTVQQAEPGLLISKTYEGRSALMHAVARADGRMLASLLQVLGTVDLSETNQHGVPILQVCISSDEALGQNAGIQEEHKLQCLQLLLEGPSKLFGVAVLGSFVRGNGLLAAAVQKGYLRILDHLDMVVQLSLGEESKDECWREEDEVIVKGDERLSPVDLAIDARVIAWLIDRGFDPDVAGLARDGRYGLLLRTLQKQPRWSRVIEQISSSTGENKDTNVVQRTCLGWLFTRRFLPVTQTVRQETVSEDGRVFALRRVSQEQLRSWGFLDSDRPEWIQGEIMSFKTAGVYGVDGDAVRRSSETGVVRWRPRLTGTEALPEHGKDSKYLRIVRQIFQRIQGQDETCNTEELVEMFHHDERLHRRFACLQSAEKDSGAGRLFEAIRSLGKDQRVDISEVSAAVIECLWEDMVALHEIVLRPRELRTLPCPGGQTWETLYDSTALVLIPTERTHMRSRAHSLASFVQARVTGSTKGLWHVQALTDNEVYTLSSGDLIPCVSLSDTSNEQALEDVTRILGEQKDAHRLLSAPADQEGSHLLYLSASEGDEALVAGAVNRFGLVKDQEETVVAALVSAARAGRTRTVSFLLDLRVDKQPMCSVGSVWQAGGMRSAGEVTDRKQIVRDLLRRGRAGRKQGLAAEEVRVDLARVAGQGWLEETRDVLDFSPQQVNQCGGSGDTPLMAAVKQAGREALRQQEKHHVTAARIIQLVELLLDKGANVIHVNASGHSALSLAAELSGRYGYTGRYGTRADSAEPAPGGENCLDYDSITLPPDGREGLGTYVWYTPQTPGPDTDGRPLTPALPRQLAVVVGKTEDRVHVKWVVDGRSTHRDEYWVSRTWYVRGAAPMVSVTGADSPDYDDVQPGLVLYMFPPQYHEICACTVKKWTEAALLVEWHTPSKQGPPQCWQPIVIETRAWWVRGANAVVARVQLPELALFILDVLLSVVHTHDDPGLIAVREGQLARALFVAAKQRFPNARFIQRLLQEGAPAHETFHGVEPLLTVASAGPMSREAAAVLMDKLEDSGETLKHERFFHAVNQGWHTLVERLIEDEDGTPGALSGYRARSLPTVCTDTVRDSLLACLLHFREPWKEIKRRSEDLEHHGVQATGESQGKPLSKTDAIRDQEDRDNSMWYILRSLLNGIYREHNEDALDVIKALNELLGTANVEVLKLLPHELFKEATDPEDAQNFSPVFFSELFAEHQYWLRKEMCEQHESDLAAGIWTADTGRRLLRFKYLIAHCHNQGTQEYLNGETSIEMAASSGWAEAVQWLLEQESWRLGRQLGAPPVTVDASHSVLPAISDVCDRIRARFDQLQAEQLSRLTVYLRQKGTRTSSPFIDIMQTRTPGVGDTLADMVLLRCGHDPLMLSLVRVAILLLSHGADLRPDDVASLSVVIRLDAKFLLDFRRRCPDCTLTPHATVAMPVGRVPFLFFILQQSKIDAQEAVRCASFWSGFPQRVIWNDESTRELDDALRKMWEPSTHPPWKCNTESLCTMLHTAAHCNNTQTVRYVLTIEAYRDTIASGLVEDSQGRTARHYCCDHETHLTLADRESEHAGEYIPPLDQLHFVIAIRVQKVRGGLGGKADAALSWALSKWEAFFNILFGIGVARDNDLMGETTLMRALREVDLGGYLVTLENVIAGGKDTYVAVSASSLRQTAVIQAKPQLITEDEITSKLSKTEYLVARDTIDSYTRPLREDDIQVATEVFEAAVFEGIADEEKRLFEEGPCPVWSTDRGVLMSKDYIHANQCAECQTTSAEMRRWVLDGWWHHHGHVVRLVDLRLVSVDKAAKFPHIEGRYVVATKDDWIYHHLDESGCNAFDPNKPIWVKKDDSTGPPKHDSKSVAKLEQMPESGDDVRWVLFTRPQHEHQAWTSVVRSNVVNVSVPPYDTQLCSPWQHVAFVDAKVMEWRECEDTQITTDPSTPMENALPAWIVGEHCGDVVEALATDVRNSLKGYRSRLLHIIAALPSGLPREFSVTFPSSLTDEFTWAMRLSGRPRYTAGSAVLHFLQGWWVMHIDGDVGWLLDEEARLVNLVNERVGSYDPTREDFVKCLTHARFTGYLAKKPGMEVSEWEHFARGVRSVENKNLIFSEVFCGLPYQRLEMARLREAIWGVRQLYSAAMIPDAARPYREAKLAQVPAATLEKNAVDIFARDALATYAPPRFGDPGRPAEGQQWIGSLTQNKQVAQLFGIHRQDETRVILESFMPYSAMSGDFTTKYRGGVFSMLEYEPFKTFRDWIGERGPTAKRRYLTPDRLVSLQEFSAMGCGDEDEWLHLEPEEARYSVKRDVRFRVMPSYESAFERPDDEAVSELKAPSFFAKSLVVTACSEKGEFVGIDIKGCPRCKGKRSKNCAHALPSVLVVDTLDKEDLATIVSGKYVLQNKLKSKRPFWKCKSGDAFGWFYWTTEGTWTISGRRDEFNRGDPGVLFSEPLDASDGFPRENWDARWYTRETYGDEIVQKEVLKYNPVSKDEYNEVLWLPKVTPDPSRAGVPAAERKVHLTPYPREYLGVICKVEQYLGSKIAFYFAFLETYVAFLLLLGFTGLSFTIAQIVCILMGKLREEHAITMWNIPLVILWGSVFLQKWTSKTMELAHLWRVENAEELEPPTAEFMRKNTKRERRTHPITGLKEPFFTPKHRLPRQIFSICVSAVAMVLVIGLMAFNVKIRDDFRANSPFGNFHSLACSIENAITIAIADKIFTMLSQKLTDWENHRQRSSELHSSIMKNFSFRFINGFSGLVITAFSGSSHYLTPPSICECNQACVTPDWPDAYRSICMSDSNATCALEPFFSRADADHCVYVQRQRNLLLQLVTQLVVQCAVQLVFEKWLPKRRLQAAAKRREAMAKRDESFPKKLPCFGLKDVMDEFENENTGMTVPNPIKGGLNFRQHSSGSCVYDVPIAGPLKALCRSLPKVATNDTIRVVSTLTCRRATDYTTPDEDRDPHMDKEKEVLKLGAEGTVQRVNDDGTFIVFVDGCSEVVLTQQDLVRIRVVCRNGCNRGRLGDRGSNLCPCCRGAGEEVAKWETGACSPPVPLTLSVEDRKAAGVPINATSFVWAYPLDESKLRVRVKFLQNLSKDFTSTICPGALVQAKDKFEGSTKPEEPVSRVVEKYAFLYVQSLDEVNKAVLLIPVGKDGERLPTTAGTGPVWVTNAIADEKLDVLEIPAIAVFSEENQNKKFRQLFEPSANWAEFWLVFAGAYLYLREDNSVLACKSIQAPSETGLSFQRPFPWKSEYTDNLWKGGRFRPITIAPLRATGASFYCWVGACEELESDVPGNPPWMASDRGAFVYLFVRRLDSDGRYKTRSEWFLDSDLDPNHAPDMEDDTWTQWQTRQREWGEALEQEPGTDLVVRRFGPDGERLTLTEWKEKTDKQLITTKWEDAARVRSEPSGTGYWPEDSAPPMHPEDRFFPLMHRQQDPIVALMHEALRPPSDEGSEFEDYTQVMLHFSYVMCFSSVLPLSPLFSLVAAVFELHSDLWRYLALSQRPYPRKASGIGAWGDLLRAILMFAVPFNMALVMTGSGPEVYGFTSPGDRESEIMFFGISTILLYALVGFVYFIIDGSAVWVKNAVLRNAWESQKKASAVQRPGSTQGGEDFMRSTEGHSKTASKVLAEGLSAGTGAGVIDPTGRQSNHRRRSSFVGAR
eukprot:Hpha_TRINITY_DN26003_c0_g1::TRINITY_DN26003_c0_g1_i1::g.115308::m.115308